MPIELKITAETVEEFDGLLARFHPGAGPVQEVEAQDEAETPLSEKPKATRQRKMAREPETGTGATAAPQESASEQTPATAAEEVEEHPMFTPKTLADVKALGNKLVSDLGAGPVQALLLEQFKVKAFGALDPADFDAAYAALEALK